MEWGETNHRKVIKSLQLVRQILKALQNRVDRTGPHLYRIFSAKLEPKFSADNKYRSRRRDQNQHRIVNQKRSTTSLQSIEVEVSQIIRRTRCKTANR